ncbi:MAG: Gfo/Idh/MocA family oxidoreductase, partial [bacterium]|nr:Gfo/Idh/MocA family oxidoreductase [bacterium]
KIEAALKRYPGATAFKDYKTLLATGVDAVFIATPAFLHPEHFEAAVEARKHIFLEKPVAVDAAGCRRIEAAAARADKTKRISVDYQQRYGADYRAAHRIVLSGELGDIKMVRASWLGGGARIKTGHPVSQEKIRNWFFYREHSGDIIVEQNSHSFDVVNWFSGMHPVRVSGRGSRQVRMYGNVFDCAACTFQFADGRLFSYSANHFKGPGARDISETFMCEDGTARVSRQGYTIWRRNQPPERVETKYDITEDAVKEFAEGVRNGMVENAAFSAAESARVGVMALEACLTGREVTWAEVM